MQIAVPVDAALPAGFIADVQEQTGVLLVQTELDAEQIQALFAGEPVTAADGMSRVPHLIAALGMEFGAVGMPGAIQYGETDLCVLADLAWFAANDLPVPADLTQSDEGTIIGSALLPAVAATPSDTRWQLVEGTCDSTAVWMVPVPEERLRAADQQNLDALGEYLLSQDGQAAVALHGLAFPLGTAPGETITVETPNATTEVTRPS